MRKSSIQNLNTRLAVHKLFTKTIRQKVFLRDIFDLYTKGFMHSDKAFVKLLTMATIRHLGQIDDILVRYVVRKPSKIVEDILRIGIAQILFLRTPHYAAVNTSVELSKRLGCSGVSGFINSVLRSVIRDEKNILSEEINLLINTPQWLSEHIINDYGVIEAEKIAMAHLSEPDLDLTFKHNSMIKTFLSEVDGIMLPGGSVRVKNQGIVTKLPGYKKGLWWIQDAAAAVPVKLLSRFLKSSASVLDVCAAPGGKTSQLLSLGFDVTSIDISPERTKILKQNLKRLSLSSKIIINNFLKWEAEDRFDAVLIDAPCSSTGTIRRHPDIPYIKSNKDIFQLIELQKKMILKGYDYVKPGGYLLYSNCSILKKEGEYLIDTLTKEYNMSLLPIKDKTDDFESSWVDSKGTIRVLPSFWESFGGVDGFFVALLQKV
ncbi:MAG: RsmB/NOP family class I SAM-dependent RNA methyltransferase [Pseudomonadota bacterium]|nr:RsmB/NOP family class I SAM-dependent RNA methyltransferase [Pseudomonadota bacterium]